MDLRERIIENAMDMFLHRGCKSVTMDDVATENGISKRTLYEMFSDKSTFLEECILYSSEKMKCNMEEMKKAPGNVLDLLFKVHENQSELSVNLRINFFIELKKFYPETYSKFVEKFAKYHTENIISFLKRGQAEGLVMSDIDTQTVSKTIIELSNIIGDKDIFSLENITRKQLFKETLIYFFRGISTQKGIEIIDKYLNQK